MNEDRYVVSTVHGYTFDPRKLSRNQKARTPLPCEASILDTYNMHLPVAVYTSGNGGQTVDHIIEAARKRCQILNLTERRDEAALLALTREPDEGLVEPFAYMCEHCPATVTLRRVEFEALNGRVICDTCAGRVIAAA